MARAEADEQVAIRVRGLVNTFGNHRVHDGLDLDVRRGEVLGVVGGSGTGKSVLLRSIIGLHRPDGGVIEVMGHRVEPGVDGDASFQRQYGVLFQDGALFGGLTVAENVSLPLAEHTDLPRPLIREIAAMKIALAGLPPNAGPKYPAELSGGMRKRAALARALALDPALLFLDEPTAGLDPIGASAFDELIRRLQRTLNLTVYMITHDLDSLEAICDRIAVLVDRRVLVDTKERLLQSEHPWIQEYFHGPRARAARDSAKAARSRRER
ncbi:MAG: ATP-binding cassette domain-containing protein [Nannocystaceae bacterium]|nr:ATP-binding cassette domain-containing protein [Myxococcales bacterium]